MKWFELSNNYKRDLIEYQYITRFINLFENKKAATRYSHLCKTVLTDKFQPEDMPTDYLIGDYNYLAMELLNYGVVIDYDNRISY
jgi:hypothetical protein